MSAGPFVPGHLFIVTITSVVYLNDIGETAYIRSENFNLVVGMLYFDVRDFLFYNFYHEWGWDEVF